MKILHDIVGVLRAYNNNEYAIKAITRALNNGIGLLIIIVNGHDEKLRGNLRASLEEKNYFKEYGNRIIFIEMTEGYTWSNALNLAFARIRIIQRFRKASDTMPAIRYVLNISIEVKWTREHLDAMSVAMKDLSPGVVGTSFKGLKKGNEVSLGSSYLHPRNTFMMIRWEAFETVGMFDPMCDLLGGMEDFSFILSMGLNGRYSFKMLDLKVDLVVGVNHNQARKETREQLACQLILDRLMQLVNTETGTTRDALKARILSLSADLGIEYKGGN